MRMMAFLKILCRGGDVGVYIKKGFFLNNFRVGKTGS